MSSDETNALSIPPSVTPGSLVSGKYRVERVLGQGAMGLVLAARHETLSQQVAIKIVAAEGVDKDEALARFLREARVVAKLDSEHIARVMDVGALEDGSPYLVMEFLRGVDLARVIHDEGALSVTLAVTYLIEAIDAVAEAHSLGIIHRDLKPPNLFRATRHDGSQRIKVLDFGISKAAIDSASGVSLTKTHSMLGSPLYMSPEQVLATKEVDQRADVWSLGVVLFELLAGVPPFTGETIGAVLGAVLSGTIPRVRSLRLDVPEVLDDAIARCLERDLQKRFSSVGELALALLPLADPRCAALVERIARLSSASASPLSDAVPETERALPVPTLIMSAPDTIETQVLAPRSIAFRSTPPASAPSPTTPVTTDPIEPSPRVSQSAVFAVLIALLIGITAGWLLRGARDHSPPRTSSQGSQLQ